MRAAVLAVILLSLWVRPSAAVDADRLSAETLQARLVSALRPQTDSARPVRCLNPLLIELREREAELPTAVRDAIHAELTPSKTSSTYISPRGLFELAYATSGTNAVPLLDVDPANGVPDFVERIATYCDASWTLQVDELGFPAPDTGTGRYRVSFEAMGAYGYTTTANATQTRIVLHNSFVGFPANDDPEGNALGAAKVTVAHEFKHATQFAGSAWSEGGWLELDATWIEESQYDEVNDYYTWLATGSPISDPGLPLDHGGAGSYEDCVWEHYLSATYGVELLLELWRHRRTHPAQAMIDSYDSVLRARGSSFRSDFTAFAAWNYATGSRAVSGFGYEEAAAYPTAPLVATWTQLPSSRIGSVRRLAADLLRVVPSGRRGTLDVHFTRVAGSALGLSAVILRTDGRMELETLSPSGDTFDGSLQTPLDQIAEIGFAIANPSPATADASWSLAVSETIAPPVAAIGLEKSFVAASVPADIASNLPLAIGNPGDPGSTLDYRVVAIEPLPPTAATSVAGSRVEVFPTSYIPGTTREVELVVTNASVDEEWIAAVTITLPTGITAVSSTDLVGGSDGPLLVASTGTTLTWIDPDGGFGRIRDGESARAVLTLVFSDDLTGDLTIPTSILGDGWSSGPHSVVGSVTLQAAGVGPATLRGPGPALRIGDTAVIEWASSDPELTLDLQLSRDNGATWTTLASQIPDAGSFPWFVEGPAARSCRLRILEESGRVRETSVPFLVYRSLPWISIAPETGSIPAGASAMHGLLVQPHGLPVGVHDAQILVLASDTLQTMDLQLTITAPGDLPALPTPALAQNSPNPFNPVTTIAYQLPADGPVRLAVFDLAGRRVATLLDGKMSAGPGQITWDGTDRAGRGVASGVYVYRLVAPGIDVSRRMVVVR